VEGPNNIAITATDVAGNAVTIRLEVRRSVASNADVPIVATIAATGGVVLGGLFGPQLFLAMAGALFPALSRGRQGQVRENEVRSMVQAYIRTHPGAFYGEIRRGLDLPNGQLMYHLRKLERGRTVWSRREGRYRRYFPLQPVGADSDPLLTKTQRDILSIVTEIPGITQSEIAYNLGESKQTVNHNVAVLSAKGLVVAKHFGKSAHLYPQDMFLTPDGQVTEDTDGAPEGTSGPPSPASPSGEETIGLNILELARLREEGILSEQEYRDKRARLLDRL